MNLTGINANLFGAITEASGEDCSFIRSAMELALLRLTEAQRVQFIRDCRETLSSDPDRYDARRWHSLQNLADTDAKDAMERAKLDASEGDFTLDHTTVDLEGAAHKRQLSFSARDINEAVNLLLRHYQNSMESVLHIDRPDIEMASVDVIQRLNNGDFAVVPTPYANVWLECGNIGLRIQKNREGCRIRRYPTRNTDSIPSRELADMDWDETLAEEYQGGISGTSLQVFDRTTEEEDLQTLLDAAEGDKDFDDE